jgi:hypothetical protein
MGQLTGFAYQLEEVVAAVVSVIVNVTMTDVPVADARKEA